MYMHVIIRSVLVLESLHGAVNERGRINDVF
jgi:hypothetical protein